MLQVWSNMNWEVAMASEDMARAFADETIVESVDTLAHDLMAKKPPSKRRMTGRIETAPAKAQACDRSMSLHVSKLRGISFDVRAKLKRNGVTYTHQLLSAAGNSDKRHEFSETSGIEELTLTRLTCRADLARIKGIGAIFADMLELLDVDRVAKLANQDPNKLHDALYTLNSAERFARRAPTPEEVDDWVTQARTLPKLVAVEA
jgi:predicted flap endonuclease-1-like 5' DNA nuclease